MNANGRSVMRFVAGKESPMLEIIKNIGKIAATDSTVMITGETGTGKDLAALIIHQQSPRSECPFVCVNCSALPETLVESELFGYHRGAFTGAVAARQGKFEQAGSGTLFLDEIGDMNIYAQAKILHCIEKKEVCPLGCSGTIPLDIRVIAATNQDLEHLMLEGKLREDLYYRLNVARVHLPPLRERKGDIQALVNHFIEKLNHRFKRTIKGFTNEAEALMLRYDWPGNVRELMNFLEVIYITLPDERVERVDLPGEFKEKLKAMDKYSCNKRTEIVFALVKTRWNKSAAARRLNCSRMTLYRNMLKYHIVEKRTFPEAGESD